MAAGKCPTCGPSTFRKLADGYYECTKCGYQGFSRKARR
jgi:ribosomal protein L37AE/L43A